MAGLAAFDFDGTLTTRDTFVSFLVRVAGRRTLGLAGARAAGSLRTTKGARDSVKLTLCRSILAGRHRDELTRLGEIHAADVLARHLRPDAVARLRWHHDQGHRVVIVSASLDTYLSPVARELGVEHLLCTTVEYDAEGRATGGLVDGNCRGVEKERRLRAWMEASGCDGPIWAYGDSAGDAELLAMADHPHRVGRTPLAACA